MYIRIFDIHTYTHNRLARQAIMNKTEVREIEEDLRILEKKKEEDAEAEEQRLKAERDSDNTDQLTAEVSEYLKVLLYLFFLA
jgi:hypothetical protein